MHDEFDPSVYQALDMMLELTGDITKLAVILTEIPEDQLYRLVARYAMLHEAIGSLPLESTNSSPSWGQNPVGEA